MYSQSREVFGKDVEITRNETQSKSMATFSQRSCDLSEPTFRFATLKVKYPVQNYAGRKLILKLMLCLCQPLGIGPVQFQVDETGTEYLEVSSSYCHFIVAVLLTISLYLPPAYFIAFFPLEVPQLTSAVATLLKISSVILIQCQCLFNAEVIVAVMSSLLQEGNVCYVRMRIPIHKLC